MALFGGESKEEKNERKVQELLNKYGLQDLSDPRDLDAVRNIAGALMGNKLIELGTAMQGGGADSAKMSYLRAIVEQNWIIIRQLDKLNSRRFAVHNVSNRTIKGFTEFQKHFVFRRSFPCFPIPYCAFGYSNLVCKFFHG